MLIVDGRPLWEIYLYGPGSDPAGKFLGFFSINERGKVLIELEQLPPWSFVEEGEFLLAVLSTGPGLSIYSAQVEKIVQENKIQVYLRKPTLVKQVQRRKYLRSQVEEEVELLVDMSTKDYSGRWKPQYVQGKVLDISAGGMLFESKFPWPEEVNFGLSFTLSEFGKLETMAKVVRKTKKDTNYHLGVSFNDLDHQDESRLVVYVYRKEQDKGNCFNKAQILKAEVATNVPALYQILKYQGNYLWQFRNKVGEGQVVMISPNAIGLVSTISIPSGSEVVLKFPFPGTKEEIKLEGLVHDTYQMEDETYFHRLNIQPNKDFEIKIGSLVYNQKLVRVVP